MKRVNKLGMPPYNHFKSQGLVTSTEKFRFFEIFVFASENLIPNGPNQCLCIFRNF
jgi:hypothetical protein